VNAARCLGAKYLTVAELTMTKEQLIANRERIVQAARDAWERRDTSNNRAAYYRACDEAALALSEHVQLQLPMPARP